MNQEIFRQIQALKREIIPNDELILFGSQARGDEKEDSDWDLAVIVDKPKGNLLEDFSTYAYPFSEIGWDYGVCINTLFYTKEQWEQGKISLFHKNVINDGINIE